MSVCVCACLFVCLFVCVLYEGSDNKSAPVEAGQFYYLWFSSLYIYSTTMAL